MKNKAIIVICAITSILLISSQIFFKKANLKPIIIFAFSISLLIVNGKQLSLHQKVFFTIELILMALLFGLRSLFKLDILPEKFILISLLIISIIFVITLIIEIILFVKEKHQ